MRLVLGGIGLVLAALLLLQWSDWPPPAPATPTAPAAAVSVAPDPAGPVDDLQPPPREDYASVTERPLFLPERRPPPDLPEDDAAGPEEPAELAGMDLTAVVITPTVVSAWVLGPSSPEMIRLRLGDEFEGWTVTGIEPDRLLLQRQGESDTLVLRDYEHASAPIPPTPVAVRQPPAAPQPASPGSASPQAGDRPPGRIPNQPAVQRPPDRRQPAVRQPVDGQPILRQPRAGVADAPSGVTPPQPRPDAPANPRQPMAPR